MHILLRTRYAKETTRNRRLSVYEKHADCHSRGPTPAAQNGSRQSRCHGEGFCDPGDSNRTEERRGKAIRARYQFPEDLDPAQFKDNLAALWIFTHALKASLECGVLANVEAAEISAGLCGALIDDIEEKQQNK
jgi:hypothetical protein